MPKTLSEKSAAIRIGRKDGLFTVETQLLLHRPLEIIFPFFADAGNLERITPPWLHFEIITPLPIVMYKDAVVDYRLRLHGIPFRWQSEITVWEPPFRFLDEQQRGPFRKWIHEHTFTDCGNNCEIRDYVQYVPTGGRLVNLLFVQKDVRQIFEYRTQKLHDIFS